MKALSLIQPWADAVLFLGKTIENRRWNTNFRGRFLIHASASVGTRSVFHESCEALRSLLQPAVWQTFQRDRLEAYGDDDDKVWRPRETMKRGGIVGEASLVDVLPPCTQTANKTGGWSGAFAAPCKHHWHAPQQYGFLLHDVHALRFVPFKGALGFVEVPDSVAREAGTGSCAHSVPACAECVAHDTLLAMST
jgi:hypothetical protein